MQGGVQGEGEGGAGWEGCGRGGASLSPLMGSGPAAL